MQFLHLEPLFAFRLALLDPQLLKVHVRAVENGARVSRIRALFGAERAELTRLGLLGFGVVLSGDGAEERGLCDAGLFEVRIYFAADFVACVWF
jgi:hypothetical protein